MPLADSEAIEVAQDAFGTRWASRHHHLATTQDGCGKNRLDRANRPRCASVRNLLGTVMAAENNAPAVPDVAALLVERPADGLARGQVGTVVEALDGASVLVEFADEQGRAYAVVPCEQSDLLVLHYVPQAA
jgi:Domain of unknown function (DUF4926)